MGKCPHYLKPVSTRKRHHNMDSFFARGFYKRPDPGILKVFMDNMGNIDHIVKGEWGFRIDIEEQEVRGIV